jgi:hypothetical protein
MLTPEQGNKLQAWLNTKGVVASCPACGKNQLNAGDIIAGSSYSAGGMSMGGPTIPMVQLVCGHCAYVRLFAAVPIGLVS